jgi:hypothetical protein
MHGYSAKSVHLKGIDGIGKDTKQAQEEKPHKEFHPGFAADFFVLHDSFPILDDFNFTALVEIDFSIEAQCFVHYSRRFYSCA